MDMLQLHTCHTGPLCSILYIYSTVFGKLLDFRFSKCIYTGSCISLINEAIIDDEIEAEFQNISRLCQMKSNHDKVPILPKMKIAIDQIPAFDVRFSSTSYFY